MKNSSVDRVPWEVRKVLDQLARWKAAAGRSAQTNTEAADWRRRLDRLSREIAKQQKVGNVDFFWWLTEYGSMVAATIQEDYQQFTPALMRSAQTSNKRKTATIAAANARRKIGQCTRDKVLKGERPVSKRQIRRINRGR